MPVSDVHRIAQQALAIGAHIQHHRDDAGGVNTTGRRVNRQLSDRNLNAAQAPIADPQNLLGVGSQNQVDVAGSRAEVDERFFNARGMVDGQINAARAPAFMVVLLHRHADRQIVDDRNHLTQVS